MTPKAILLLLAALLTACAQTPPKEVPRPTGLYVPPSFNSERTASIAGSISRLIDTRQRARLESIEYQEIPIAPEAEQPPVIVASGKRTLVVVCETNFRTASDRTDIEVEFLAGHEYKLTCGTANLWVHNGSNFQVIDVTAGNRVVTTAFAPGRAYPPRGRLF